MPYEAFTTAVLICKKCHTACRGCTPKLPACFDQEPLHEDYRYATSLARGVPVTSAECDCARHAERIAEWRAQCTRDRADAKRREAQANRRDRLANKLGAMALHGPQVTTTTGVFAKLAAARKVKAPDSMSDAQVAAPKAPETTSDVPMAWPESDDDWLSDTPASLREQHAPPSAANPTPLKVEHMIKDEDMAQPALTPVGAFTAYMPQALKWRKQVPATTRWPLDTVRDAQAADTAFRFACKKKGVSITNAYAARHEDGFNEPFWTQVADGVNPRDVTIQLS